MGLRARGMGPYNHWMRFHVLICAGLLGLTAIIYGQTARFEFVNYDDYAYVVENVHIAEGLNGETLRWAFTTTYFANWIPLTWVSYLVDVSLFGKNPGGFHLVNMFWHGVAGLLLYRVMLLYSERRWLSVFVAAVFVAHPMHVESVAWISERKDLLSAAFGFAALWAYWRYAKGGGALWYGACLLAFVCGLISKPMLVTLPVILLMLDYAPLGRFADRAPWRGVILEKAPFLVIAVVVAGVTLSAQSSAESIQGAATISLSESVPNAVYSYGVYVWKFFVPFPLVPFYPHPEGSLALWKPGFVLLGIVGFSVYCWRRRKNEPAWIVCWAMYLLLLLPVIGFVQVGGQAMADRYSYLPYVPLSVLVAMVVYRVAESSEIRTKVASTVGCVFVIGLAVLAMLHTSIWRNSETLWETTLKLSPDNIVAHSNLAHAKLAQGEYAIAIEHAQRAVELNPEMVPSLLHLGRAYRETGQLQESATALKQAIVIAPEDAEAHNQLGQTLLSAGQVAQAEAAYREAVRVDPGHAESHNNLGNVLLRQNREADAVQWFLIAVDLNPYRAESWSNLGACYILQGKNEEAGDALSRSLELDSGNAVTHVNYAVTLMNAGNLDGAMEHAKRGLALDPDYAQGQALKAHLTRLQVSGE